MRISCTKDDLLQRLQVVSRGVSQRSSVQILSGVLIDAWSAEAPVLLAATDMELSVRANLHADVARAGPHRRPGPAAARHRPAPASQKVELASGEGGPGEAGVRGE